MGTPVTKMITPLQDFPSRCAEKLTSTYMSNPYAFFGSEILLYPPSTPKYAPAVLYAVPLVSRKSTTAKMSGLVYLNNCNYLASVV